MRFLARYPSPIHHRDTSQGQGYAGRDTHPGLTVSFGPQSVELAAAIANQVLHVAVRNLRGPWAAVICQEKETS